MLAPFASYCMSSALRDNSCAFKEGIPTANAIIKAITPFKLACLVIIKIDPDGNKSKTTDGHS